MMTSIVRKAEERMTRIAGEFCTWLRLGKLWAPDFLLLQLLTSDSLLSQVLTPGLLTLNSCIPDTCLLDDS